jgi:hypothetical protein
MIRGILMILFLAIVSGTNIAQDQVIVISEKANLRGTPNIAGVIVTTVSSGEKFELIKEEAPWYLVQTPKYVGWLHGNAISKDLDRYLELDRIADVSPRPRTTSKPISAGESPFKVEYVGVDYTIIQVTNSANRTLTLTFGGLKYVIPRAGERTIEADGGNYEFFAAAPGVRPASGVKNFAKGRKYSWDFYIVTR